MEDDKHIQNKHIPKVSIGMPVYNGEKFVREALDSLLLQSFTDFELIISDNASTDKTEEICRGYAQCDSRIRYVRQSENWGGEANSHFVLDKARGEYFMWAACDDWWNPFFINELTSILDLNPSVVLSFCAFNQVDMNKKILCEYPMVKKIAISKKQNKIIQVFTRNSFEKYLLQCSMHGKVNLIYGLIRRKQLVSADIMRRWGDFGWGNDILCVASILRYGNAAFSPLMLWHKTLNPESMGSLPQRIGQPNFLESVRGATDTLIKYIKYSIGIWQVQGTMPGTKKIKILRRIGFTLFEFFRIIFAFIYQLFCASVNRLKPVIGGSKSKQGQVQ